MSIKNIVTGQLSSITEYTASGEVTDILTTGNVTGATIIGDTLSTGTGNLQITGNTISTAASTITIDPLGDGGPLGSMIVTGNLQVTGTLTYNDVVNATTNDLQWIAANNAASESLATGAGLSVGPDGAYAQLTYDSTANSWQSSLPLSVNGNVTADYFIGNGSQLTGLPAEYTNANVAAYLASNTNVVINTTGSIKSTGNITGGNLDTAGQVSATGNITTSGTVTATNIGNIAALSLNGNAASYLNGSGTWSSPNTSGPGMRTITKVDQIYGYGTQLMIADGRLYAMKGIGLGQSYNSALNPNSSACALQSGINNTYEISFINETPGTVVDAGSYGYSSYALMANGNLYTWGYNGYGQLGLGNTADSLLPTLSNTNVAQVYTHPSQASSPNAAIQRLVIRKTNNTFFGCGHDGQYQLGLGTTTNKTSWTVMPWIPADVLSVWNLGGDLGNMFIQKADGTIFVTGWNARGQLGVGNTTQPTVPVSANAWTGADYTMRIKYIAWGGPYADSGGTSNFCNITLFLDNGSTSRICGSGDNNWGSLGTNNTTNSTVPVVPSVSTGMTGRVAKMLSVGSSPKTLYVLLTTGVLYSWGYNTYGQAGNGANQNVLQPYQMTTGVLDIDGAVQGWDTNGYYSMSPFVKKSTGYFACGFNTYGQLGDGTDVSRNSLTRLRITSDITFKYFGCYGQNEGLTRFGVDTNNTIWMWGYNAYSAIDPLQPNWNAVIPLNFTPAALMLDAGGTAATTYAPAFSASSATVNVNIPSSFAAVQIPFATVDIDTNGWYSTVTNRFTPKRPGWYQISCAAWAYTGAPFSVENLVFLRKNGALVAQADSFGLINGQISKLVYCNGSTDYLDVAITSGVAGTASQSPVKTYFTGFWVRP